MADLRIPAQPPARPLPPARAEAVRAAQRAFFETALAGETQAARTPSPPRAVEAETPPRASEVRVPVDPQAAAPPRLLRPGSLLDIKV